MKGLIIYKGKYGATRQYANWVAQELNLPVIAADENEGSISGFNLLVIGTSVYMGKLLIIPWLKQNLSALNGKKLYLFMVAGTPAEEKQKLNLYTLGIPEEIRNQCEIYFLPGRLIKKKLSFRDRITLSMAAKLTKDPASKKIMMDDYNNVRIENIAGLVNAVKKFFASQNETVQIA